MSKKYEILRPKEYSGRQIALPEEEFWELAKDLEDMKLEISTLEKENQELEQANNLLVEDYNKLKALADKVDLENQELKNTYELILDSRDKEILELKAVNKELVNKFINQQDQFLKIVESVLNKAEIYYFDLIDLENGTTALNQPIITELIQEIKRAIEKGKE